MRLMGDKAERTADEAANRRLSARWWALPSDVRRAVEREVEGHLLLGTGQAGERRLLDLLSQVEVAA